MINPPSETIEQQKLEQSRLKELFTYDKDTGEFTRRRKICGSNGLKVGEKKDDKGYYRIKIDKKQYRLHQLAFLYIYGYIPKEIDHKNKNRADNSIENLRDVSRTQNMRNKNIYKNNSSGEKGIHINKNGMFIVQISGSDGKRYRGQFKSIEEAKAVRKQYEKKFNYE